MRDGMVWLIVAGLAVGHAGAKMPAKSAPTAGKTAEAVKAGPPHPTAEGVRFTWAGTGKAVFLAGSFNGWEATRQSLAVAAPGLWAVTLPLPAGPHQYKFVVDGNWVQDPANPRSADDGHGGKNSLLDVTTAQAAMWAAGPKAVPGGVRFTWRGGGTRVELAGSFNGWQRDPMTQERPGLWVKTLKLGPGTHQYKFVVDNDWKPDPDNPDTVDDGYGGKNSVRRVP